MTDFCNDVNDWLITGGDLSLAQDVTGRSPEATALALIERGVSFVLDVRSEWSDAGVWQDVDPSVQYCHAPIIDSHRHKPVEAWYGAVEDFVERFWLESGEGDRMYVHCHMGINRGTSAAMLALLTVDPLMDPFDAFLAVREARPVAGVVYGEHVGMRHLRDDPEGQAEFLRKWNNYWTPALIQSVNRGIAYYRTKEGGTIKVAGQPVLVCPAALKHPDSGLTHRIKWNSGQPVCMDCGEFAVSAGS